MPGFGRLGLILLVAALAIGGLRGASAAGLQMADMFRFADEPDFVSTGTGWLLRTDSTITTAARVYDAEPGAYTMWWIVWNTPEGCLEPWACTEADLFNSDAGLAVGYAGGAVAGPNGILYIWSHLSEGTPLIGFPYPEFSSIGVALTETTLIDSRHAEVHLVLRSHQQPGAGSIGEALRTFNAACVYEDPIAGSAPAYGTPGASQCVDTYFAVFPSENAP